MPAVRRRGAQQALHPPFSLPLAFIAAALAGVGRNPLRRHYLGAAAVCATLALLPVAGETADILMDAAIAVSLAVAGIGDHRLLAATIEPRSKRVHAHV